MTLQCYCVPFFLCVLSNALPNCHFFFFWYLFSNMIVSFEFLRFVVELESELLSCNTSKHCRCCIFRTKTFHVQLWISHIHLSVGKTTMMTKINGLMLTTTNVKQSKKKTTTESNNIVLNKYNFKDDDGLCLTGIKRTNRKEIRTFNSKKMDWNKKKC